MKKVLFICNHRKNRSPGQRFRFEQYLDFLENKGYQCEVSYLLNEKDDRVFYSKGNFIKKLIVFIKAIKIRLSNLNNKGRYDIIFLFREAFFTGTTFFEKRLVSSKAKLIFDFDDAIWLHDVSAGNKKWGWLKRPEKTVEIIKLSDMIFAGNQYLVDFAKKYNSNVKLIPTTIDTNYHISKRIENDKICIGWTGTSTTLKYFEDMIPVLLKVKQKYEHKVTFKVIVDVVKEYPELGIKTTPWTLATEIEELNKIDIGIMPLKNDEWTKGKCGFKGLQYMSLSIPTIMSPVGVNSEIIQHGENGFLADTKEEWVEALSQLIESELLRKKLGQNARTTVLEKYSVQANQQKYLDAFNSLFERFQ